MTSVLLTMRWRLARVFGLSEVPATLTAACEENNGIAINRDEKQED